MIPTKGSEVSMTGDDGEVESQRQTGSAPVVTISATYGAGGSVIGPLLAERLQMPFVDRLLRSELATEAGRQGHLGHSSECLSDEEVGSATGNRFLSYLARSASVGSLLVAPDAFEDDTLVREHAEAACIDASAAGGGVILGRAGAIVLNGVPLAFHIRLDGPAERRRLRAQQIEQIPAHEATIRMEHTDRARALYVRRLYQMDPTDPAWYHLVLDTTVLPLDVSAELIAEATKAFWQAQRAELSEAGQQ